MSAKQVHKLIADIAAGVLVLVVLVVGVVLVIQHSDIAAPSTTTTITKNAVPRVEGDAKTTTVTVEVRGDVRRTTTTSESPAIAGQPRQVTTTHTSGERTFVERALDDDGLVFIKLGIVLLAAFIGGALVQRAILGQYGVKIGSFELADLASGSADAVEALRAQHDTDREATTEAIKRLTAQAATKADDLSVVFARLSDVETRLAAIPPPVAAEKSPDSEPRKQTRTKRSKG